MKMTRFCFGYAILFVSLPIFCAKITILNHAEVAIKTNISTNQIENTKEQNVETTASNFNVTFKKNNTNYECTNILIQGDALYTVGKDLKVYSDKKINNKSQWTCEKSLPTFTVTNKIPNTTAYVWLGAEEGFKDIGTQKNVKNVKIESTNKDITVFGLHIDVNNSTQKIKCNDIRIENGKQYVINNNNGIITVNEQQNSCYLVGKITIENNVSELTDKFKVNTRIPGGNSIDIDLTSDRNTQNFTITLTPTTEKTYTLKVTAFPGITKYEIKKDANSNYVLVAGNQTIPFVKK